MSIEWFILIITGNILFLIYGIPYLFMNVWYYVVLDKNQRQEINKDNYNWII